MVRCWYRCVNSINEQPEILALRGAPAGEREADWTSALECATRQRPE
jgi:hypothetical protein